jgi:hypothetical protein
VIGNLHYPTNKVRVRAEYLDKPSAIADELRLREAQRQALGTASEAPRRSVGLSSVARLFDVKEHWVALGCAASLVLLALSRLAHPKDHPRVLILYLGLVVTVAASAWFGALVGLYTASFRSVGAPS